MSGFCWEQTDIQFQRVKRLWVNVVLFLALYRAFNNKELLSSDSPAEINVSEVSLPQRVFCPPRPGITRQPYGLAIQLPGLYLSLSLSLREEEREWNFLDLDLNLRETDKYCWV